MQTTDTLATEAVTLTEQAHELRYELATVAPFLHDVAAFGRKCEALVTSGGCCQHEADRIDTATGWGSLFTLLDGLRLDDALNLYGAS